jgi:hypothetical protein
VNHALFSLDDVAEVIRQGPPAAQKKAITAVFERIEVDRVAEITKAVPRERVRPLLINPQSLLILYVKCPQGTWSAHHVATLAGRSTPQPEKTAKRLRVRFRDRDLILQPLSLRKPCADPSTGLALDYNDVGHHSDVPDVPSRQNGVPYGVPSCTPRVRSVPPQLWWNYAMPSLVLVSTLSGERRLMTNLG